jgi:hypothetical protein
MKRSLMWALFILVVMASASLTAVAETRALGVPISPATPLPTPCPHTGPATGDACQAVEAMDQSLQARTMDRTAMNQMAITDACSAPDAQRDVCVDMASRVTLNLTPTTRAIQP